MLWQLNWVVSLNAQDLPQLAFLAGFILGQSDSLHPPSSLPDLILVSQIPHLWSFVMFLLPGRLSHPPTSRFHLLNGICQTSSLVCLYPQNRWGFTGVFCFVLFFLTPYSYLPTAFITAMVKYIFYKLSFEMLVSSIELKALWRKKTYCIVHQLPPASGHSNCTQELLNKSVWIIFPFPVVVCRKRSSEKYPTESRMSIKPTGNIIWVQISGYSLPTKAATSLLSFSFFLHSRNIHAKQERVQWDAGTISEPFGHRPAFP